jgi:hypothetical protein
MHCQKSIFGGAGEDSGPAMYTDEPVYKKDVARAQNFSRFNLLTKITVFAL